MSTTDKAVGPAVGEETTGAPAFQAEAPVLAADTCNARIDCPAIYFAGWPNPMSSMYTMPVPPAFGLFRSPTPMVIFWTLVVLTPAAVRSLSGIFHCVQAPVAAAAGSALADELALAGAVRHHHVHTRRIVVLRAVDLGPLPGAGDVARRGDVVELEGPLLARVRGHADADVDRSVIVMVWGVPCSVHVVPLAET